MRRNALRFAPYLPAVERMKMRREALITIEAQASLKNLTIAYGATITVMNSKKTLCNFGG